MPKVSAAFFATGLLCICVGGALGLNMAGGGTALYSGIHVHLNLVGWATMALCGTFYALTKETMSASIAWLNYAVLTAGILVFFPSYAWSLGHGNNLALAPIMMVGNGLTALGMLIFAISVFRELFRRQL